MNQPPEIATACEAKSEKNNDFTMNGPNCIHPDKIQQSGEMGTSQIKRRRDNLLEEERDDVPEPGSGRVLHLVKAFERLLAIPNSKDSDQKDEKESEDEKGMKWALQGLQPKVQGTQVSSSSFCPEDFVLTSASLGLDSHVSSSLDSTHGSITTSSRISGGARRTRRNSSGSSGAFGGSRWKKQQLKATCQKPFNLRTEYYPDVNKRPGAEEKFKEISAAYECVASESTLSIVTIKSLQLKEAGTTGSRGR